MRFHDTTGMMRWNRENRIPRGMRGVTRAILLHDQTITAAEAILAEEHGTRHQPGEHSLCPKCREHNDKDQRRAETPRRTEKQ